MRQGNPRRSRWDSGAPSRFQPSRHRWMRASGYMIEASQDSTRSFFHYQLNEEDGSSPGVEALYRGQPRSLGVGK